MQIEWFLRKEQDTRYYKCSQPGLRWRVGSWRFWSGVTLQDREGGGPQAHPASALGRNLPFLWKDHGSEGKEGERCSLVLACAGRARSLLTLSLWWSSLPTVRGNFISLLLTTSEKSFFVGFLFLCPGVAELIWDDSIATIAEKTGRVALFFFPGYSVLFYDLFGMLKY